MLTNMQQCLELKCIIEGEVLYATFSCRYSFTKPLNFAKENYISLRQPFYGEQEEHTLPFAFRFLVDQTG